MILIDVTYANWTPEKLEHGETNDQCLIFQDELIKFQKFSRINEKVAGLKL